VDPLASLRGEIAAIGDLEVTLSDLDEGALAARAATVRSRVAAGASPRTEATLRVETFALVREAARRRLGLRPYDEQIAAGLALYQGGIAEMATGEGKTLAAVAPVLLRAFEGRGTHVLTFNDYLARRDGAWMGPVFDLLGASVGVVQEGATRAERRRAYRCDVTYLTAKECGFDLLRDGLCLELAEQVHRPFHSALVDEADSILIDEARVPLVIAGRAAASAPGLTRFAEIARRLNELMAERQRSLSFHVDEVSGKTVITVRQAGTNQIVRQIPSEEALAVARLFEETGVLVDARI